MILVSARSVKKTMVITLQHFLHRALTRSKAGSCSVSLRLLELRSSGLEGVERKLDLLITLATILHHREEVKRRLALLTTLATILHYRANSSKAFSNSDVKKIAKLHRDLLKVVADY